MTHLNQYRNFVKKGTKAPATWNNKMSDATSDEGKVRETSYEEEKNCVSTQF